jgi:hypothetical protein
MRPIRVLRNRGGRPATSSLIETVDFVGEASVKSINCAVTRA